MTNKTALVIAFNVMSDVLDDMEREYGALDAREEPYYKDVEAAMTIIARMINKMA